MTGGLRRGIAAVVLALAVAGAAGCGSSDNGGVIEGPTTSKGPAATRSSDYGG